MLPKSCSSDDIHKNEEANALRKTLSSASTEIFDYLDNGISRSHSQFSGILTIAPNSLENSKHPSSISIPVPTEFQFKSSQKNGGLKEKLVGFFKKHIKIIPVMLKSNEEKKQEEKKEEDVEIQKASEERDKKKNGKKMMDSESDVYEIDELNSTIAPSSSRQCIVGADLECVPPAPKKPKKKPQQRTDFHPKPPFSCVPIYTAILVGLLIVLIIGAVTTIIDMRPTFIYGLPDNSTNITHVPVVFDDPPISFSTLKPQ